MEPRNWEELMNKALNDNLHEFVRIFADEGMVDFTQYLTRERLRSLYNEVTLL